MHYLAITFLLINVVLLWVLPRRWAPLPLLVGGCYMTLGQVIEIGPFHFHVLRLLILAGLVRIIARGEWLAGGMNALDRLLLVWAAWAALSSYFHQDPTTALISRLGLVYNALGIYFLLRVFCRSLDDLIGLFRITAILLVPLALEMAYEKLTMHNLFASLGGVSEMPAIRDGRGRAQGPFLHSILAGTIAAASLPLIIALWHKHRSAAAFGVAAGIMMILASASSGPVLTAAAGFGALAMWKWRHQMRLARWLAIFGYIVLDWVMKDPAYYLMARIDIVGGSAGWHRARLIESAFEHLHEWWLAGTDYTRHWMPSGVAWSPDHADITNYYLRMGVLGGLPLMLLFIAILFTAFFYLGRAMEQGADLPHRNRFLIWAVGASLFAHSVTFLSVNYFDQSSLFIYLTLAAVGSAYAATHRTADSSLLLHRLSEAAYGAARQSHG